MVVVAIEDMLEIENVNALLRYRQPGLRYGCQSLAL